MKQIWKLRCQKMAFSALSQILFLGQFFANFSNFSDSRKKYLNTIVTLFLFFLSISVLGKAGKNNYQVKRFHLPCFLAIQKKVKMVKNSRRRKKSSPGRHSALVTVRSVQSGHGICQNLCKNQAFLMVLNLDLQNIYGTLQVQICKVSNLARGPCKSTFRI